MNKIILSLTLIGTLAVTPLSIANQDNPNDRVRYKKTSIEEPSEISETSILVEDTLEPRCNCKDKNCPKENERSNKIEKKN